MPNHDEISARLNAAIRQDYVDVINSRPTTPTTAMNDLRVLLRPVKQDEEAFNILLMTTRSLICFGYSIEEVARISERSPTVVMTLQQIAMFRLVSGKIRLDTGELCNAAACWCVYNAELIVDAIDFELRQVA